MTPKSIVLLAAFVALAPLAAAEYNESKPPCPPDQFCTTSTPDDGSTVEDRKGNESEDTPTYDGNCGGEVCAYGDDPNRPVSSNDETSDDGSSCMDGEQEGEACRDDAQYLTPPGDGREPAPTQESTSDGGDSRKSVPALGLGAVLAGLGVVALVAARRR